MTRELNKRIGEVVNACKDHMTIEDMGVEFDLDPKQIRRYCKIHEITVVSPKQVIINYMADMKGRKTLDQIAASTGYCIAYLHSLIKSLGQEVEDYKVVPLCKEVFQRNQVSCSH